MRRRGLLGVVVGRKGEMRAIDSGSCFSYEALEMVTKNVPRSTV
jgi:hypothetical protein